MTWIDRVLRRRRIYDDLSEEIRAHLDEKAEAFRAAGMSSAEAQAAARRAFGNATRIQEDGRETWALPTLDSFLQDCRYALRQVGRAPGMAATIIVTLALGIAATTTVFSWARSVLLDPIPGAADAGRLMALETTTSSGSWTPTSWLDYRDFRKYLTTFDDLAAAYPMELAIGDDARAERTAGELVSANFFEVLRVRPALGRLFPPTLDEAEGAQPSVVIGYGLWQRRWRGDSSVIGSVVRVNRFPFTVIGVAPASFRGSMPGEDLELWIPAAMLGQVVPTGAWWLHDRGTRTFRVLARLAPGVTAEEARADAKALAARMEKANGDVAKGMSALLLPIWQSHWGVQDELRKPLGVLLAACGLVLIIVCANAANLLLARATSRRRELAMRFALGAPRSRLVRQLLTEASVLAVSGSALGLFCTIWLARALRWLLPSFAVQSLVAPHVDSQVLVFTAVLAGLVTLVAGIAPALHASHDALNDALTDGARGSVGGVRATRIRSMLVTAETALAVVALVGAGIFYDSYRHARGVSPAFDASHVAMGSVSITLAGYDSARGEGFLRSVVDKLRSEPGVKAASYTDYVPLSLGSGSWEDLTVEGYTPEPGENMKLTRAAVGPDYFAVLGIPLVVGRDFTFADDSASTHVMIVNEAFVHRYLHGRAALGVRVHGWGRWFTIVGVAKDTKTYRVTDPPAPYFYVPVRQVYRPEYGYTFLVRTVAPVDQAVLAISHAVQSIDPSVPVYDAMPLWDYIQGPLQGEQAALQLLAILAGLSLLLAAVGLYGVVSYAVAQRTKEIGVRIALGAQRSNVLRLVALQAGALLVMGLLLGLVGAAAIARLVASMLFGVGALDLTVFAFAVVAMSIVAAAAAWIPAWRAMVVDPTIALRSD